MALPFGPGIYSVAGRLESAAVAAGLSLSIGMPEDTGSGERIALRPVDADTGSVLADMIGNGIAGATGADSSVRSCRSAEPGIDEAGTWLRTMIAAAGLDLVVETPTVTSAGPLLPLDDIDQATGGALAALLEESLAAAHSIVVDLRSALLQHDIAVADVRLHRGYVLLGIVSVPDADMLHWLLHSDDDVPETDPGDVLAAERLVNGIDDAIVALTGEVVFDAAYLPSCRRCGEDPAIDLGCVRPAAARVLTVHLRGASA